MNDLFLMQGCITRKARAGKSFAEVFDREGEGFRKIQYAFFPLAEWYLYENVGLHKTLGSIPRKMKF